MTFYLPFFSLSLHYLRIPTIIIYNFILCTLVYCNDERTLNKKNFYAIQF